MPLASVRTLPSDESAISTVAAPAAGVDAPAAGVPVEDVEGLEVDEGVPAGRVAVGVPPDAEPETVVATAFTGDATDVATLLTLVATDSLASSLQAMANGINTSPTKAKAGRTDMW